MHPGGPRRSQRAARGDPRIRGRDRGGGRDVEPGAADITERQEAFEALIDRFEATEDPIRHGMATVMLSFLVGLFVGEGGYEAIRDNLELEREKWQRAGGGGRARTYRLAAPVVDRRDWTIAYAEALAILTDPAGDRATQVQPGAAIEGERPQSPSAEGGSRVEGSKPDRSS